MAISSARIKSANKRGNPYHVPAGSPKGGQFTYAKGGSKTYTADQAYKMSKRFKNEWKLRPAIQPSVFVNKKTGERTKNEFALSRIKFNPNPNHQDAVAIGISPTGEKKQMYTVKHFELMNARKFKKQQDLAVDHTAIMTQVQKDMMSNDPATRDAARATWAINRTGLRPGSEKETGAAVQAYGMTQMLGKHVTVYGSRVTLDFTGKSAVEQSHTYKDATLAAIFRSAAGKRNQAVFPNTNYNKTLNYFNKLKGKTGTTYTLKDLRIRNACMWATEKIKTMKKPKTLKEYKAAVIEVGQFVGRRLGHGVTKTGTQIYKTALDNYINPIVFKGWQGANK